MGPNGWRAGSPFLWAAVLIVTVMLVAGCAAERPAWLQQEDAACFQARGFGEEIPQYFRGDPLHDPCWRWRSGGAGGRGGR